MHLLVDENFCIEYEKGIYAELDGEIIETFETELPSNVEWDMSKLPEFEWENIRFLVLNKDSKALAILHNKYKLSDNSYCCFLDAVLPGFKYILKYYGRE